MTAIKITPEVLPVLINATIYHPWIVFLKLCSPFEQNEKFFCWQNLNELFSLNQHFVAENSVHAASHNILQKNLVIYHIKYFTYFLKFLRQRVDKIVVSMSNNGLLCFTCMTGTKKYQNK